MKNKGFTLIELLVVIAIIGILSSVVLASLNSARRKGADAAIKANLANIRASAELYYDENNDYGDLATDCAGGMFAADANISKAIQSAANASNIKVSGVSCSATGQTNASEWAIAVPLRSNNTESWCVDSRGGSEKGVIQNGQCVAQLIIPV